MTSPTGGTQVINQEKIHQESMALAPSATGIIPFMDEEIVRLEEESQKFQNGELENAEFTPFRLRQGVYGQRQADVQMIRVKLPGGIITARIGRDVRVLCCGIIGGGGAVATTQRTEPGDRPNDGDRES